MWKRLEFEGTKIKAIVSKQQKVVEPLAKRYPADFVPIQHSIDRLVL